MMMKMLTMLMMTSTMMMVTCPIGLQRLRVRAGEAMADEVPVEEGVDGQDIFYIAEEALKTIKKKVADKETVTAEDVNALTFPENLANDAMMVPVDMRGVGQDFDDVEQMIDKLGAQPNAGI